jgi:hypothetical protein
MVTVHRSYDHNGHGHNGKLAIITAIRGFRAASKWQHTYGPSQVLGEEVVQLVLRICAQQPASDDPDSRLIARSPQHLKRQKPA